MEKPSVTFLWRESAPYVVSINHGTENNKRQNLSVHTKYFKVSCWYCAGSQNLTYLSQKATMSVLLLQPVQFECSIGCKCMPRLQKLPQLR